ncbi:hypothetical protein DRE_06719 [Drechslerella stenobrocha 248]|uniref:AAA+ ATPase domain-containing protein n=1 Tax=Drechslerella stenobrocha 248 TaxID=1043628 RepID=W7HWW0_9PEZI|nr:hypothetical protein DRE_06719 [Drechslerella stenobrocha 248]
MAVDYKVPTWFLEKNVRRQAGFDKAGSTFSVVREDLASISRKLPRGAIDLRNSDGYADKATKAPGNGDAAVEQTDHYDFPSPQSEDYTPTKYSMPYDDYIEIRDQSAGSFLMDSECKPHQERSSLVLQVKEELAPSGYTEALVKYLADDLMVHLISVTLQDLNDLAADFHNQDYEAARTQQQLQQQTPYRDVGANSAVESHQTGESEEGTVDLSEDYAMAKFYFGTPNPNKNKYNPKGHLRNKAALKALITATTYNNGGILADRPSDAAAEDRTPLLIFVRDALPILKLPSGHRLISRLRDAIIELRNAGAPVLGIFSCLGEDPGNIGVQKAVRKTRATGFHSWPLTSEVQRWLKEESALAIREVNVRDLKHSLKQSYLHLVDESIVGSEAQWTWGGMSKASAFLCHGEIAVKERHRIANLIAARAWRKPRIEPKDIVDILHREEVNRTGRETTEGDISCVRIVADGRAGLDLNAMLHMVGARGSRPTSDSDDMEEMLSKHVVKPGQSAVTYDDVILDPNTKTTVRQLLNISQLDVRGKLPSLIEHLKISGILLFGPPGTGKTHLCRAIANDFGHTFIALSAAELTSCLVGDTEKLIRAAFSLARKHHPSILFLDEVDAIFYKRTDTDKSWQRGALTQYLKEMDGLASGDSGSRNPIVIAATNQPSDLDEAFLRRLPHKVYFRLPHGRERRKILNGLLKDSLETKIDIEELLALAPSSHLEEASGDIDQNIPTQRDNAVGEIQMKLTMQHFNIAFRRTGPSTSPELLENLMEFRDRFRTSCVPPI